ncbi:hypothetical protein B0H67DRAFT_646093 [Lasiosphaeris hirsuta]|uniref:Uncharacterized protein n=1 Tax=Lasiosphaeris hirsuta TaxID=260670 RepID=A0AA40A7L4_9PEZI|nr:hypothetical protein B0H67DRAFT_646093 [Lasiosphaeris hirsuta]
MAAAQVIPFQTVDVVRWNNVDRAPATLAQFQARLAQPDFNAIAAGDRLTIANLYQARVQAPLPAKTPRQLFHDLCNLLAGGAENQPNTLPAAFTNRLHAFATTGVKYIVQYRRTPATGTLTEFRIYAGGAAEEEIGGAWTIFHVKNNGPNAALVNQTIANPS